MGCDSSPYKPCIVLGESLICVIVMATEEVATKKMRVMSIENIFDDIVTERKDSVEVSSGVAEREIFKTIGLSFKNSRSLEGMLWADLSEVPDEDDRDMYTTREIVLQDTDNSVSLSMSGPTTVGADKTLKKLLFPCVGLSCACKGTVMFPLNHLMPTLVEGLKKDYCHESFNKFMGSSISKKAFKLGVVQMRTAEKCAVTLDDTMVHAPLENLIFNSYKKCENIYKEKGNVFWTSWVTRIIASWSWT